MTIWNLLAGHLLSILSYFLAILSLVHMLRHRRSPGGTMAWLVVLVLLPFVGTALYLTFGGRKLRTDRAHRSGGRGLSEPLLGWTHARDSLADSAAALGAFPVRSGNRVSLHQAGEGAYAALCRVIDQAETRLCLQTFIFAQDEIGADLLERLAKKASQGLQVRLLVDGLGSLRTSRNFYREFEAAGGQLAVFKPVLHVPFRSQTNLRNHRKIAVADGNHSFSGGINITREELNSNQSQADWDDVALSIIGPAAGDLEQVFESDWQFATAEKTTADLRSPTVSTAQQSLQRELVEPQQLETQRTPDDPTLLGQVQILPSGPEMPFDTLYAVTLTAIYQAAERIWIGTPYFVPDDALIDALKFASLRGVDVRILVPTQSNHWFSDIAAGALLRELAECKVTVYRYQPRMLHAKTMMVDRHFAAVGSANFDMRSLFLNYEIMQFLYSPHHIQQVQEWFEAKFECCEIGMPTATPTRSLLEGITRALSPMF